MNDLTALPITIPATNPTSPDGLALPPWPELFAQLLVELPPADLLERNWLRDIAILTARSDQLRIIQAGMHRYHMYRLTQGRDPEADGPAALDPVRGWTRDPAELAGVQHIVAGLSAVDNVTLGDLDPILGRLLGMVYSDFLALYAQLESMLSMVLSERDRIIMQLETRRAGRAAQERELAELTRALEVHRHPVATPELS